MISIDGHLAIRTISGRNGDFNVGKLSTSIGEFVIKEALLDQYTEGKYTGNFVITQIKPQSYSHAGRFVIEIRAYIDSMQLDDVDDLPESDAQAIEGQTPDPIEAEKPFAAPVETQTSAEAETVAVTQTAGTEKKPADNNPENTDAQLFGHLWPLGEIVKLDTTVDRVRLREQKDRLQALGYEFDFRSQQWQLLAQF